MFRSFILYSFASISFSLCIIFIVVEAKVKLSIYILMILISFFVCQMRILRLLLSCFKLMLLYKTMTFLSQSLLKILNLYRLFSNLQNWSSQICQNLYISGDNFMKIKCLLSSDKLFRYMFTISI